MAALGGFGVVRGEPPPACAADAAPSPRVPDDLRPAVDAAVARGAAFLRAAARPEGGWRWSVDGHRGYSHWVPAACDEGLTSLAVLALARAGVPRTDPVVARALDGLRARWSSPVPRPAGGDARTFTYGAGAMLWMLSEVAPPGFRDPAGQAALALAHGVGLEGRWPYTLPRVEVRDGYARVLDDPPSAEPPDLSNAQFAVLGLLAAGRLGTWAGAEPWEAVRDGARAAARRDGGFGYRHDDAAPEVFQRGRRLPTAIAAGNLVVALRRLGATPAQASRDPTVRRALAWLDARPFVDRSTGRWARRDVGDQTDRAPYLEMLAVERLGIFLGADRLAGADWYRVGATTLLGLQGADGGWPGGTEEAAFQNAVERTTLALLFLTRALDAVPVTSPALTTGDLVGAADALEPGFSARIEQSVRAHAEADGDARLAWERAFVTVGPRALRAVIRCQREGPAALAPAAHGLLVLLTRAPVTVTDREARADAWARWWFAMGPRVRASADGTRFEVAPADAPPK